MSSAQNSPRVVIDMSGESSGRPGAARKWKGSSKYPLGVGILISVLAISGFLVGIRGLVWWTQLVLGICWVTSLTFLYLTYTADPGVILPNLMKDPIVEKLDRDDQTIPDRQRYKRDWKGQWQRKQKDGSIERYCTACNIWRPPRASHCSTCGYCMERFDHHCQVIGNCVARCNHRFFVVFLISAQIGCGLMAAGAAWRLRELGFPGQMSWLNPETLLLLFLNVIYVYMFLMLFFGIGHCFSILCDMTTKDLLTESDGPRDMPCVGTRSFSNLSKAWGWICCAPFRWKFDTEDRVRTEGATRASGPDDSPPSKSSGEYGFSSSEHEYAADTPESSEDSAADSADEEKPSPSPSPSPSPEAVEETVEVAVGDEFEESPEARDEEAGEAGVSEADVEEASPAGAPAASEAPQAAGEAPGMGAQQTPGSAGGL